MVGFDLGGTKMLASVFDANLKQLSRKRKRTKAHEGLENGLERIRQLITAALKEAKIEPAQIRGIGIGCPGPLNLETGTILEAPNLGWENVPIVEELKQAFGCPVVVANDVDLGVYAEWLMGAARNARCVLGVFPGTGIGGGCVYNGEIIRGSVLSCMEIGHIQVLPDGPVCGCGRRGCLEAVASRLAVSAAAAAAVHRGQAPYLQKKAGTDLSEIRSGTLAAAIEAGDKIIEQIVRSAAEYIGIAVANVVHLMAPDVIVLGGGLVEAMPELLRSVIEQSAKSRVLPSYRDTFRVVVAELGDDVALIGAAAWARRMLGSPTPTAT
ncbi:MAG: ROK family protein [Planctomycetes bacterium]|nr:ROK family protein [Planctomycetota bacterium]